MCLEFSAGVTLVVCMYLIWNISSNKRPNENTSLAALHFGGISATSGAENDRFGKN